VEKYCRAGQATDFNVSHAHYVLYNWSYRYTLRICNTYCFSPATVVVRTLIACLIHFYSIFSGKSLKLWRVLEVLLKFLYEISVLLTTLTLHYRPRCTVRPWTHSKVLYIKIAPLRATVGIQPPAFFKGCRLFVLAVFFRVSEIDFQPQTWPVTNPFSYPWHVKRDVVSVIGLIGSNYVASSSLRHNSWLFMCYRYKDLFPGSCNVVIWWVYFN